MDEQEQAQPLIEGGEQVEKSLFTAFFVERGRYYNRIFNAPPGVNLPEASASAMSDFIQLMELGCE